MSRLNIILKFCVFYTENFVFSKIIIYICLGKQHQGFVVSKPCVHNKTSILTQKRETIHVVFLYVINKSFMFQSQLRKAAQREQVY